MVFKSLDSSFCGIPEMDMRGNKLVGDLLLKEGIIEDVKSFIIHYMEFGIVYIICECYKEFLDPFVDACT